MNDDKLVAVRCVAGAGTLFHGLAVNDRAEGVTIGSSSAGITAGVVPLTSTLPEGEIGRGDDDGRKRRGVREGQQASEGGQRVSS